MKTMRTIVSPKGIPLVGLCRLAIAVSMFSAVMISRAGTVVTWGSNQFNQTNNPAGLTDVIAIAAGSKETLALKRDGTVVGWGGNYGNGLSSPPAGLTNVIAVAIGSSNSMGLKADGSVVVWGRNNFGPVSAPPGLTNMVAVASGFINSWGLRQDGVLFSWPSTGAKSLTVLQSNVVGVATGDLSGGAFHILALQPSGSVLAWGANSQGECDVPLELTNAVAVSAGYGYSLAVRDDGTVMAWGKIWNGSAYVPYTVPAEATNVIAISTRDRIGMALRADGTVVAWGSYYQWPNAEIPVTTPTTLTNVIAISAGGSHCVALVGDGPPILQASATPVLEDENRISLSLPTQSGRVYLLEQSDSLAGTNWTAVTMAPGNGTSQTLTDQTSTNDVRFYRVRRW